MGYCIEQVDNDFFIAAENQEKALLKLKDFVSKQVFLSWITISEVMASKNLSDALDCCRYQTEEDSDGNIVAIFFQGTKSGNDFDIFNSIAEFVKEGSYIEMIGEDNFRWRWLFKDNKCKEISPKIIWEE